MRQRKPSGRQNRRKAIGRPEIHDHPYECHEHKPPVQKFLGYTGSAGKPCIDESFLRGARHDLFRDCKQGTALTLWQSRDFAQSYHLVDAKKSRQNEASPGDQPRIAGRNTQFVGTYIARRGSPGNDCDEEPLKENCGSIEGQAIGGSQFRLAQEPLHSSVAPPGDDNTEKQENQDKVPRNKEGIHRQKWKHVFAMQRKKRMSTRQLRRRNKMVRQETRPSGTHDQERLSAVLGSANQAAVRDARRGGGFCASASRRIRSASIGSGGQAI